MHLLIRIALPACVHGTPANGDRKGSLRAVDPTSASGDGGHDTNDSGAPAMGATPENFAAGVAEAVCDHLLDRYGAEALADAGYADVNACVGDTVVDLPDWASCPSYDPRVAGDCLEVYAESTCAQLKNPNPYASCYPRRLRIFARRHLRKRPLGSNDAAFTQNAH